MALDLPAGGRRAVELSVQVDGRDVVVRVRDVSARAERRPRLETLAALGAAIQRERSEAAILGRVRDGLRAIGGSRPSSCAPRRSASGSAWAAPAPAVATAFDAELAPVIDTRAPGGRSRARRGRTAPRTPTTGAPTSRPSWASPRLRRRVRRRSRSASPAPIAVRLDERTAIRQYLVLVGDWLDRGDVAAVRLFGAQVAAALDAARIIADSPAATRNSRRWTGSAPSRATPPISSFFARAAGLLRTAAGCDGLAIHVLDDRAGELVCLHRRRSGGAGARRPRLALLAARRRRARSRRAGGGGGAGGSRRRPRGEPRVRHSAQLSVSRARGWSAS